MNVIILIGILFFWLFSPESLALIGNGAGQGMGVFIPVLIVSASLVAAGAFLTGVRPASDRMTCLSSLTSWQGIRCVLGLSAMTGTALFASAGMLVSAGFIFNEVFIYWFPNFSFSSLLLLLVVVLQQLPPRMTAFIQGALVMLTLGCLIILVVAGFFGNAAVFAVSRAGGAVSFSSVLPLLLIFAGFEQSFARGGTSFSSSRILYCFLGTVIVIIAWGMVLAKYVAADHLSSSSIPFMHAASAVLGQTGRMVMGIAVISGSCAAVNGLFGLSSSYLAGITGAGASRYIIRGMVLVLALAIGGLWLMGVAGSRNLELFIRGSLLLWLLYGGAMVLAGSTSIDRPSLWKNLAARIIGCVLVLYSVLMTCFYGHYRVMGLFLVSLLTGAALCIKVVLLVHRRKTSE